MDAMQFENDQYLTFILTNEIFAIEIRKVKEVLEYTKITAVPNMPNYLNGVINLRGNVVPVIDLRTKFNMERAEKTINTSIIILEIMFEEELLILGAIVDSVKEVLEIESSQMSPPPKIGVPLNTSFIKAMGKYNNEFIIILNIDKVFTEGELLVVQSSKENI